MDFDLVGEISNNFINTLYTHIFKYNLNHWFDYKK